MSHRPVFLEDLSNADTILLLDNVNSEYNDVISGAQPARGTTCVLYQYVDLDV